MPKKETESLELIIVGTNCCDSRSFHIFAVVSSGAVIRCNHFIVKCSYSTTNPNISPSKDVGPIYHTSTSILQAYPSSLQRLSITATIPYTEDKEWEVVLSDRSIKEELEKGRLIIKPFDPDCVQPASVDIHLDGKFQVFDDWKFPHYIDLHQSLDGLTREVTVKRGDYFSLQPGRFVLGSTLEFIAIADDLMARLEGKSSLGRLGLLIHSTAGYVDPGWRGHLTLELYNISQMPIHLYPTMKVSQISFHRLTTSAERPYGTAGLKSKYLDQVGPTPTRYHQEFQQPQLMSLSSVPVSTKQATKNQTTSVLRDWLNESKFQGNVRLFSEELNIPQKTVENWIYRDVAVSPKYQAKVFKITHLPHYKHGNTTETLWLEPSE